MDRKRLEYITTRYLEGKALPEEEEELLRTIESSPDQDEAFRRQTAEWNPLDRPDLRMEQKWNRLSGLISGENEMERPAAPFLFIPHTRFIRIAAAVAIICLVSLMAYWFTSTSSDSALSWQTLTAEGTDRSLTLPDGSSVFLREGATLTYPTVFPTASRDVRLAGEAFFDIVPNAQQPFTVEAGGLYVRVLGTSFSVRAAEPTDTVSVILVEGKVGLNDRNRKEIVRLSPDQKADYSLKNGRYTVATVDSKRLTSWRKGVIAYENASLPEIVRLIEQTYHVSITYQEDTTQRFSGAFLKRQPLETVLEQTEKLTGTPLTVSP